MLSSSASPLAYHHGHGQHNTTFTSESSDSSFGYNTFTIEMNSSSNNSGQTRKYGACVYWRSCHECYCIVSEHAHFNFLNQVMLVCHLLRSLSGAKAMYSFLAPFFDRSVPCAGEQFTVSLNEKWENGDEAIGHQFDFVRPSLLDDDNLEFCLSRFDVSPLFSQLTPRQVIQLFYAVLCEQRIVIVGDDARLVSQCCHSLTALIYPFRWQHIFIPYVSKATIPMVCRSNHPFIVGIHSGMLSEMTQCFFNQGSSMSSLTTSTRQALLVDLKNKSVQSFAPSPANPNRANGTASVATPTTTASGGHTYKYDSEHMFGDLRLTVEKLIEEYQDQYDSIVDADPLCVSVSSLSDAILDRFLDVLVSLFGKYRLFSRTNKDYSIDLDLLLEEALTDIPDNQLAKKQSVKDLFKRMRNSKLLKVFLADRSTAYRENGSNPVLNNEFEIRCARLLPSEYGFDKESIPSKREIITPSLVPTRVIASTTSTLKDAMKPVSSGQYVSSQTTQNKVTTSKNYDTKSKSFFGSWFGKWGKTGSTTSISDSRVAPANEAKDYSAPLLSSSTPNTSQPESPEYLEELPLDSGIESEITSILNGPTQADQHFAGGTFAEHHQLVGPYAVSKSISEDLLVFSSPQKLTPSTEPVQPQFDPFADSPLPIQQNDLVIDFKGDFESDPFAGDPFNDA